MIRLLSYHYLLLVLAICMTFTENLVSQAFYPLKVGNRWDYSFSQRNFPPNPPDTTYSYSVLVTGQRILPNGKPYFELSRNDLTNYGRFVRVDSNCVYYYNQSDSTEFLVYKFTAHLHDYWQIGPSPARGARLSDTGSRQIFSRLSNFLVFTLGNLVFKQITFSDRFGPVELSSNGEPPGTSSTFITILGCLVSDSLFGTLTSVAQSQSNEPTQLRLYQNYPNPFNPTTAIHFAVGKPGSVELSIFGQLGQLVYRRDQYIVTPGEYSFIWHASFQPSGVYFCRLQAGAYIATCKMLLVK